MSTKISSWNDYSEWKGFSSTAFPKEILLEHAGQRVLDIGCGLGKHLECLGKRELKVGIEVTDDWFKKEKLLDKDIDFMVASAYKLSFEDKSFDTVIMIDVIEHLLQPIDALNEIKRVLMDKGVLILQTPNYPIKRLYDIKNWLRTEWKKDWKDDPTHVSKFSFYKLERLIVKNFNILDSFTRNVIKEDTLLFSDSFKRSVVGKLIGQKTIIIADK